MRPGRLAIVCCVLLSLPPGLFALPKGGTCLYNWKPVGNGNFAPGFDAHVWDLEVVPQGSPLGPAVYACGNFTHVNLLQIVNHVAKWNGHTWVALSGPSANGLNGDCHSLAMGPDGFLYAGGVFTTAGGVTVSGIARWDGSAWSALGDGATRGFLNAAGNDVGTVFDLLFYDGGWGPGVTGNQWLVAGGSFASAHPPVPGLSPQVHGIARWNGTAWHRFGPYPDDGVDGSHYFGSPQLNDILGYDLGSGPSLYLGGGYSEAGGASADSIARWDGGFSPLGNGIGLVSGAGFVQALAGFQDQLYVAGQFDHAGPNPANHLARWNGLTWSGAGGPVGIEGFVEGLYTANLGNGVNLYMAGFFLEVWSPSGFPNQPAKHIARFDGQKWMKMGAGLFPDTNDEGAPEDRPHGMVMAHRLEADGNCLYVGGLFQKAGTVPAASIARWCCNKTPFYPSEMINAYPVNAQVPFSFTDNDGDGLPESIACDDDVEIPVFPGTEMQACGLRFVFGTSRNDDLHLETSTLPLVVFGGPGRNEVFGSRFDDLIFGGSDDESLTGGAGDDQIYGGFGDDVLLGDLGDDRLVAGPGDDRLDPGPGLNAVDGGDGMDTAFIQPADEMVDVEAVTVLDGRGGSRSRRK